MQKIKGARKHEPTGSELGTRNCLFNGSMARFHKSFPALRIRQQAAAGLRLIDVDFRSLAPLGISPGGSNAAKAPQLDNLRELT
jgi:hypothetical protein